MEAVSGTEVVAIDSRQGHDDAVAVGTDDFIPLDVTPGLELPLALLAQFLRLAITGNMPSVTPMNSHDV